MSEKIWIILLPLIYLSTFILRNQMVKARVKQPIRAADPMLTAAIIGIVLSILITVLSTFSSGWYGMMGAITILRFQPVSHLGLILFGFSIIMGWIFSAQLKQSWRVGVHADQKTELIQSGVYTHIRNPYFLSYFIMFLGLFLVRPSLVLGLFIAITVALFHGLVLKEEIYLQGVHGNAYEQYRNRTGRYFPLKRK